MRDETHLMITRYQGEGVFVEDSNGNEEFFTADSMGCYRVSTRDGHVDIAITPNRTQYHGDYQVDFFAPRSVRILREELKGA